MQQLLALAERYYSSAEEGLRFIPGRPRSAIVIASRVYRAIGLRLLRVHGGNALIGRTVVPKWERAWWVLRGVFGSLSPRVLGLRRYRPHEAYLHDALADLSGANTGASLGEVP